MFSLEKHISYFSRNSKYNLHGSCDASIKKGALLIEQLPLQTVTWIRSLEKSFQYHLSYMSHLESVHYRPSQKEKNSASSEITTVNHLSKKCNNSTDIIT